MRVHKRILVFARHPEGGIRTYFRYVYGHSCLDDIELSFATPNSDSIHSVLAMLPNAREHIVSKDTSLWLFVTLLKALLARRFDLIHSHGFTAGVLASIPARLFGVPHIITTHDVFNEGQFIGSKGKLKKWLIGRFLALGNKVNPVGMDARENLINNYPYLEKKGKVIAIRNGIDVSAFLIEEARNLREEVGLDANVLLVGFFGRFMAQKGFSTLVDAVDRWNSVPANARLHVACFGWGGFIREEQEHLRARNLDSFFHFFPSTNEVAKALRGVDAVVMPSRWEACPLLPMEAFVSGVPLIATDCIGLHEVTESTPALKFKTDNPDSLVQALILFSKNKNQICMEAETFREEAAQRFDVKLTALGVREVFLSV